MNSMLVPMNTPYQCPRTRTALKLQGEALRVSGAKRDDLQAVIAHLRANPPGIPLQFTNYR